MAEDTQTDEEKEAAKAEAAEKAAAEKEAAQKKASSQPKAAQQPQTVYVQARKSEPVPTITDADYKTTTHKTTGTVTAHIGE